MYSDSVSLLRKKTSYKQYKAYNERSNQCFFVLSSIRTRVSV